MKVKLNITLKTDPARFKPFSPEITLPENNFVMDIPDKYMEDGNITFNGFLWLNRQFFLGLSALYDKLEEELDEEDE